MISAATKGAAQGSVAGGPAGAVLGAAKGLARSGLKKGNRKKLALILVAIMLPMMGTTFVPMALVGGLMMSIGGFESSQNTAAYNVAVKSQAVQSSQMDALEGAAESSGTPWEVLAAVAYYETGPGKTVGTQEGTCPTPAATTTPVAATTPATTAPPYCPAVAAATSTAGSTTPTATPPTATQPTTLPLVAPKSVTVVGDGLIVGAQTQGGLQSDLTNVGVTKVDIQATTGSGLTTPGQGAGAPRNWPAQIPQLVAMDHPDLLVIALGTSDYSVTNYGATVTSLLASIPSTQKVLWVLPAPAKLLLPGIANISTQITTAAAAHSNVTTVASNPIWLDPAGGGSYGVAGYQGLSGLITKSVSGPQPTLSPTGTGTVTTPTIPAPVGLGPFGIKASALTSAQRAKASDLQWSAKWVADQIRMALTAQPTWDNQPFDAGEVIPADSPASIDPTSSVAKIVRTDFLAALAKIPVAGNSKTFDRNVLGLGMDWYLGIAPAPGPASGSGLTCGVPAGTGLSVSSPGGGVTTIDAEQLSNAAVIVHTGQSLSIPQPGLVIAIMTALVESTIENLPNARVPGSITSPNVQFGGYGPSGPPPDGTSVGFFQQQNNWGSVTQRMDPVAETKSFFGAPSAGPAGLLQIPNWQSLPLGVAAQSVQVSAFPDRYAAWEGGATAIVNFVLNVPCTSTGTPSTVTATPGVYYNPLRGIAGLTPERVDNGVDYAGAGPLYSIGDGVVVSVTNSGWPGNAFIAVKLTDGPATGAVVYEAENITPAVTLGQQVTANTVLGTLVNAFPHLETGWATPSPIGTSLAIAYGGFHDGASAALGLNFNQLLIKLGAPSGVLYPAMGTLPAGWPTW